MKKLATAYRIAVAFATIHMGYMAAAVLWPHDTILAGLTAVAFFVLFLDNMEEWMKS